MAAVLSLGEILREYEEILSTRTSHLFLRDTKMSLRTSSARKITRNMPSWSSFFVPRSAFCLHDDPHTTTVESVRAVIVNPLCIREGSEQR